MAQKDDERVGGMDYIYPILHVSVERVSGTMPLYVETMHVSPCRGLGAVTRRCGWRQRNNGIAYFFDREKRYAKKGEDKQGVGRRHGTYKAA